MELFFMKDGQIHLNEEYIGSVKAERLFLNLIEDHEKLETFEAVCGDCNCDSCSDQYETENGVEYDLFYDDETDGIRLDIDPSQVWTKDDAWELINHILYAVGETDEDGNFIPEGDSPNVNGLTEDLEDYQDFMGKSIGELFQYEDSKPEEVKTVSSPSWYIDATEEKVRQKPLFILSYPDYNISAEHADAIKDSAKGALKEAGIDAVPIILVGNAKAYFEFPPIR